MMNITFEFACQDDCLDKMVPSDLRKLVNERDHLAGKVLAINAYCQKNKIGEWGASVSDALIAHCDALAAKAAALDALIVAMQERATLYLQPGGEPNANFISYILTMLDGPEQRAAQATPVQCLANVRADAIKKAAQKALDAAQVPPASPIRSDYFKAGVRCCAAALVEYAEKVRGGAV